MKYSEINTALTQKIITLENTRNHVKSEIDRLSCELEDIENAIIDLNIAWGAIQDIAKSVGD